MIRELLIKKLRDEIKEIEKSKFEIKDLYTDGMIDGLEKAINFVKIVLQ